MLVAVLRTKKVYVVQLFGFWYSRNNCVCVFFIVECVRLCIVYGLMHSPIQVTVTPDF